MLQKLFTTILVGSAIFGVSSASARENTAKNPNSGTITNCGFNKADGTNCGKKKTPTPTSALLPASFDFGVNLVTGGDDLACPYPADGTAVQSALSDSDNSTCVYFYMRGTENQGGNSPLVVDFGAAKTLTGYTLVSAIDEAFVFPAQQYSVDGFTWTNTTSTVVDDAVANTRTTTMLGGSVQARYVRFTSPAGFGNWVNLKEAQFLGY